VALTAVLPLRSEAEVQARLHIRSARLLSFFLLNCPIQQLLQPTVPLRKKLLPQKTHNPKNNNANPHAHNLKE
jgi:capsular polysaccharide biosynthesis protein